MATLIKNEEEKVIIKSKSLSSNSIRSLNEAATILVEIRRKSITNKNE
jgi:hypothetical protein